jgi:hypothetical protein
LCRWAAAGASRRRFFSPAYPAPSRPRSPAVTAMAPPDGARDCAVTVATPPGDGRECVVCLEVYHSRGDAESMDVACSPGCKGRTAVCAECLSKLARCVYCRASLRAGSARGGARASLCPHPRCTRLRIITALALSLIAVTGAAIFLLGEMSRRREDAPPV